MGKIKLVRTTFAEIDREWKERMNFTYEELMNSDDEISNFSELNEKVDEVLFQNWKKSEDKKMKVLKTIKTKSGKELKIYNATLEEMDNEFKNNLNFSDEEFEVSNNNSENGLIQFSERLDEIWFQNWKKSELESIEELEQLAKKKNEGN